MNWIKRFFSKENKVTQLETKVQHANRLLDAYKRVAYIPVTQNAEPKFSADSKFGGLPYLNEQNSWPICPGCHKKMKLFLQLDLRNIPEERENSLLQLFYCTTEDPHCESDFEAFFPFSKASVCRKVIISVESDEIEYDLDDHLPEVRIHQWTKVFDYPHPEEYYDLGIDLESDEELEYELEKRKIGVTYAGDKLFGWPFWVQSVEYPADRVSGTPMNLFFQINSVENLAYMFGDAGIGHITISPDNKNELGFGWACY